MNSSQLSTASERPLFGPQGGEGIDTRRAPNGHHAGADRDHRQHARNAGERQRIPGGQPDEHRVENAAERERPGEAEHQADRHLRQAAPQEHIVGRDVGLTRWRANKNVPGLGMAPDTAPGEPAKWTVNCLVCGSMSSVPGAATKGTTCGPGSGPTRTGAPSSNT